MPARHCTTQAVDAQRRAAGTTNWEAIALLYEGLVRVTPAIGTLVGGPVGLRHDRAVREFLLERFGLSR
jgi:hypothetical protein